MDEITVTVPARTEFVPILRSVIASVAARLNITYDGVDDLRLAIDEAASHLIGLGAGTTLVLVLRPTADRFEVISTVDVAPQEWPPSDASESLTWQILSGLADEAAFDRAEGGQASIRFMKKVGTA